MILYVYIIIDVLVGVVLRLVNAVRQINLYPVDDTICSAITYLLVSDSSIG